MKHLFLLLLCSMALLTQSVCSQTVPIQPFELGYGATKSVDFGVTPASFQVPRPGYTIPGFYTLMFSSINSLGNYPGYYFGRVNFGTQELCHFSGWGQGVLTQTTIICPSPGYLIVNSSLSCDTTPCTVGPAQGNANLILIVTVNGWPIKFQNVSLPFTSSPDIPVPTAVSVNATLLWADNTPVQGSVGISQVDASGVQRVLVGGSLDATGKISLTASVDVQSNMITLRGDLYDLTGAYVTTFQQTFPSVFVKMLTGPETCTFTLVKGSNPVSLAKFPSCQP